MMKWFGWKTREMLDVYSHITMEDVEERYLSALLPNLNNSNNSNKELRICLRCGFSVSSDFNYCPRCGQPLTVEASYKKLKESVKKEKEIEEAKSMILKIAELLSRKPDLLDHLRRELLR